MTHKIVRPLVAQLSGDAVHTGSVWADWRALAGADGEGYTAYGAETCDACGAVVVLTEGQGGESHRALDGRDCDGHVSMFEGPAMSYSYALPGTCEPLDDAKRIAHLPLCLIAWGESSGREGWALALTGGGMDLSWEICEAFMVLGYLPPLKYAGRLPDLSGKGGAGARYVLSGARASIRVARNWLRNDARHVAQLTKAVREHDATRKGTR